MSVRIVILNGPNLNLLGLRQPDIYGHDTLEDVARKCSDLAQTLGLETELFQTNHEGELVEMIHAARASAENEGAAGIIINPAAFSHTSVAVLDALMAFDGPVLEVHISNIHKREAFRHHSYVSSRADGVIAGCGVQGYELAVQRMATLLKA
ncbi:MAG: type II 3-dehydroquinate dehydratase [Pseudomonadota bacterium]